MQLVYADGYYYLVAYNEKHDGFPHYRVDRMEHIALLDEPASRNDRIATFDAGKLEQRAFGMYGGEPVSATLLVSGEAMGGVIDRFGEDVPVTSAGEEHAHVHVAVVESPAFFGWVAQFGSRVRIEKPAALANAYRDYLKNILDAYE